MVPHTAGEEGRASNNVGKGLYSHLFPYGATWLQDEELPLAGTAQLSIRIR